MVHFSMQEEMEEIQGTLAVENRQLMKEQARQQRIAATVTEQMSVEAQVKWVVCTR